MVFLHRDYSVCVEVAAFNPAKLDDEVCRLKWLPNFNVNCARNSIACKETQLVVVQVQIYGSAPVDVKHLVPENSSVPSDGGLSD